MTVNPVELFGGIDIYVFDQLLRGRIAPGMRIADAGCGHGRNLQYFLRSGYDCCGADASPEAIDTVRRMAATLAPALPADNFRVEPVESMSFPDGHADVVISNAVLHFARDDAHFDAMLQGTWRILKPGGVLIVRLASSIGIENAVRPLDNGRYILPDGSTRYLVTAERLEARTADLGATLLDPIKTTLVHRQRSMTTWVVRKG
jgi:tellurite methyltransferase